MQLCLYGGSLALETVADGVDSSLDQRWGLLGAGVAGLIPGVEGEVRVGDELADAVEGARCDLGIAGSSRKLKGGEDDFGVGQLVLFFDGIQCLFCRFCELCIPLGLLGRRNGVQ